MDNADRIFAQEETAQLKRSNLTFGRLASVNLTRCNRWHPDGITVWSVTDWATATAGELGEACNAIKKLRRIQDGVANISEPGRQLSEQLEAVEAIGAELADTVIYLDLLAQRLGIDLGAAVVAKFNKTSEKYEFPERL